MMELNKIYQGGCIDVLKIFPDNCIDCCVTSPPYFGLRDYGHAGQIGLEETPEIYVNKMVEVFTEVKRVLKNTGTLWLNLGDSYSLGKTGRTILEGLKPKDLIGIPWLVAFALRSSGWCLRQDIIWHKPNPMPESVTDRCTKSHEYIFLLSKSPKYFYDADAIKTDIKDATIKRLRQSNLNNQQGSDRVPGKTNGNMKPVIKGYEHRGEGDKKLTGHSGNYSANGELIGDGKANKKSVWTVTTKPFKEAHFATFPEGLIVDCIKAGAPEDGVILDPFMGAGTTGLVARKLNRNYIGIEINSDYIKIAENRINAAIGLFK